MKNRLLLLLLLLIILIPAVTGCGKPQAFKLLDADPKDVIEYTPTDIVESPKKETGWLLMARLLVKDAPDLDEKTARAIAADFIEKNKDFHNGMKFTVIGLKPENPNMPGVEQIGVVYRVAYAASPQGARAAGLKWEGKKVISFKKQ